MGLHDPTLDDAILVLAQPPGVGPCQAPSAAPAKRLYLPPQRFPEPAAVVFPPPAVTLLRPGWRKPRTCGNFEA